MVLASESAPTDPSATSDVSAEFFADMVVWGPSDLKRQTPIIGTLDNQLMRAYRLLIERLSIEELLLSQVMFGISVRKRHTAYLRFRIVGSRKLQLKMLRICGPRKAWLFPLWQLIFQVIPLTTSDLVIVTRIKLQRTV